MDIVNSCGQVKNTQTKHMEKYKPDMLSCNLVKTPDFLVIFYIFLIILKMTYN